jgi:pyruvate,orthophosphate dikinase
VTWVYDHDHRHDVSFEGVVRLLGGKAANLGVMAVELGLPVPPAFTLSTAACAEYRAHGWPAGLDEELREHMARLEARVGRRFGDPQDPLLVSVRSGAPVSMPGMMDTILDLGLNDATEAGLAAASGDPAFAADCRTRFEAMYRDIVGVEAVPADPWKQLRGAIEAVFRSWDSGRARAYRAREGIPDDLGTGVTVQAMVFGNRGADSATGVLFTRDPATGAPVVYGDVLFDAQGEDVVAGTHATAHLSALDERMPDVARQLRAAAATLERHHRDLCDVEFTVEEGRLWLLQCRVGKRSPQAALRIAVDMAQDPGFPLTREEAVRRVAAVLADPPRIVTGRREVGPPIAMGLGASPGVASGGIATTPEAAIEAAEQGRAVILVRAETSPDDVAGMARSAGILTATGGLASHAAVVARGWGIPAVVGAVGVAAGADSVVMGDRTLAAGEVITVDGTTGEVFAGAVPGTAEVAPDAITLLGWAKELGIPIGREDAAAPADVSPTSMEATTDDVLRVLLVKGYATPEATADALASSPDATATILQGLIADGRAERAAGSIRLTASGKDAAAELFASDSATWGLEAACAALDAFVAFDRRVKATVSAWQMRVVDGTSAVNDHTDASYDARVLADLGTLHAEAATWLHDQAVGLPRLARYVVRLDHACAAAQAGDGRYVASPRVDSYHTAWFELHEDLIRLAGRTRTEEVAAGRA